MQGAQGAQGQTGSAGATLASLEGAKTIPYTFGSGPGESSNIPPGSGAWFAYMQGATALIADVTSFEKAAFVVNQPSALTALHAYVQLAPDPDGGAPVDVAVWRAASGEAVPTPVVGYQVTIGPSATYRSVRSDPTTMYPFAPRVLLSPGDRIALRVFNADADDDTVLFTAISASIRI